MRKSDHFEYIRNAYGVPAKKGQRVKYRKRTGTISKADGHYIYILLDGDLKPTGPYHPASEIEYLSKEPARTCDDDVVIPIPVVGQIRAKLGKATPLEPIAEGNEQTCETCDDFNAQRNNEWSHWIPKKEAR